MRGWTFAGYPARISDIALGKLPKARAMDQLRADEFLLAIAGVKPGEVVEEPEVIDNRLAEITLSFGIGRVPDFPQEVTDAEAKPMSGPGDAQRPVLAPACNRSITVRHAPARHRHH